MCKWCEEYDGGEFHYCSGINSAYFSFSDPKDALVFTELTIAVAVPSPPQGTKVESPTAFGPFTRFIVTTVIVSDGAEAQANTL